MIQALDDTDRELLSLLQANAREGTAMLARKLGLARTTVVARIARLERSGVVAGYGVRLGTRLDATTVRAWCSIS
ncbi:MAG: Lrp/AsnC family transcriptional regulator, partial [Gammaproteobacteria bacterium]|nr:Lrp/AsnC family transcriptional regulator [Gammaproteobacteria bacterium]